LRIGYVISDSRHYERLVRVKQAADIATPGLNQRAIHLMLQRGILSQQLERNNHELLHRRNVALAAAERHLPPGSHWIAPEGGIYLWVQLPKTGPNSAELYITAVHTGVAYAIGNVFYTNGCGSHRMRLNYGTQPPDQIEEGFQRLGRAWRELACDYEDIDKSLLL
jgi:DNA-binding transcriptional MocR family regulator